MNSAASLKLAYLESTAEAVLDGLLEASSTLPCGSDPIGRGSVKAARSDNL